MADRVTSTEMKTQTPARGPAGGPAREFAPWIRNLLPALRFAAAQLKQSQAPTMAANLAFRTLFGLLPVLVVATIVTRAILGERFDEQIGAAIDALGMHEVAF